MRSLFILNQPSCESINEKNDVVSMNVPLMIRIFEYINEEVKDDVEIHDIAERLVQLCNTSDKALTMDQYDEIIGKVESSEEGLKNSTHTTIVINMDNVDQATALTEALTKFSYKANVGGDIEMMINLSDNEIKSCGIIGHDVRIGKIYHNIPKEEKE